SAELLRETWPVERIGEEEQAGEVVLGIGCGEARHPAAVGAAADHNVWAGAGLLQEEWDGAFGVARRQLDSLSVDTPCGKPIDVRLQRLHAARGTRTQEHLHSDYSIASSVAYSAGLMMSQVPWTVPAALQPVTTVPQSCLEFGTHKRRHWQPPISSGRVLTFNSSFGRDCRRAACGPSRPAHDSTSPPERRWASAATGCRNRRGRLRDI